MLNGTDELRATISQSIALISPASQIVALVIALATPNVVCGSCCRFRPADVAVATCVQLEQTAVKKM